MPISKKKTTTKKRTGRKTTKRKGTDTRVIYPGDTFWTKVINGMKKLLSPAFPKQRGINETISVSNSTCRHQKWLWFITGIAIIYFMYDEVIDDEDEDNDD